MGWSLPTGEFVLCPASNLCRCAGQIKTQQVQYLASPTQWQCQVITGAKGCTPRPTQQPVGGPDRRALCLRG